MRPRSSRHPESRRRRIAGRDAFTLLEVLVALVIVAMAVVVLGASYLNVLTTYEAAARGMTVNEDFAFARDQILREPDRKKLEEGGEFEAIGGRRVTWSVEIESTSMPNVFQVAFTTELADPARPEPERRTQRLVVLRPTWVIDVAERDKLKEDVKRRILEIQGRQTP